MMSMLDRPYTVGEVDWLLAEQAHRYRQDLSRLGDERDALVAQHDRDAETIAELRKERDEWKDAAQEAITNSFKLTRGKLGAANHESTFDAALRVVAERDEARGLLALAEGVAAALPDPDAQNPEHLRFAADLIQKETDGNPRIFVNARMLHENADRIEAAQERANADEKLIEQAAQVMSDAADRGSMSLSWDRLPDSTRANWRANARALHAAGLLALDAARAEAGQ